MYLVSACLAGVKCRYDGKNVPNKEIEQLVKEGKAIAICPEVLGGLDIPRGCLEIIENKENKERRVVNKKNQDMTEAFMNGAKKTLEICKVSDISRVILKSKSPSCGCGKIYDGTFTGQLIDGNGITAELLLKNNINVYNENNWKDFR